MDFFDTLVRYETDLWNHLDDRLLAAGETSLATLDTLRVIARHPGTARVAELQDELRITVGAASKAADRLERDGLAQRRPNPADRRSSVLELTATGRRALEGGVTVLERELRAHLADSAEAADVAATLRELTARLAAVPAR
jgi:DNA-binding MarR family transcriptional regulator